MFCLFDKFAEIDDVTYKELQNGLPKSRKIKWEKIKDELDQKISVVEYYMVKHMLGLSKNVDFSYTANGKPFVLGAKKFNISHSYNVLCAAADDVEVGVDIQKIAEYNDGVARYICNEQEYEAVVNSEHKAKELTRLFTLKESALKCLDLPLAYDLKDILSVKNLVFETRYYKDYVISVCKIKNL